MTQLNGEDIMKRAIPFFLCLILSGCISTSIRTDDGLSMDNKRPRDLTNLRQVKIGMSQQEVVDLMGDHTVIGYEMEKSKEDAYTPIVLKNPYRLETLKVQDKTLEAAFYYTHVKQADDIIADEELTPLVFQEGKLIGKGWPFWNMILKKKDRL